jgi:hypothetical protein
MSISSISSSTNAFQSQFQQISKDFTALQSDLSSNNLSGAQQAYTTLTQDLQNVWQARGEKQGGGNSQISSDLAAVGNALQSNDLAGAQSAFTTLTQDLQSAGQAPAGQQTYGHHHHHRHGGGSQAASTTSTTLSNDLAAVGNALQSGNLTTAQSAFTTLMQDLGNSSTQNTTGASGNSTLTLSVSFVNISIVV